MYKQLLSHHIDYYFLAAFFSPAKIFDLSEDRGGGGGGGGGGGFENGDSPRLTEWRPPRSVRAEPPVQHSMTTVRGAVPMKKKERRPASPATRTWKPRRAIFLFSAVVLLHACCGFASGGMCWGSMGKNGLCKDLLAVRMSKEKCCKLGGSSVSTSWSPTDLDSGTLFFWRVLGDGVPCSRCKGSCAGVVCGADKKCVMRSNLPKCVCAPDCKRRDGSWVKGPVCGTDGVSYKSHCRLKKRSCRTRDQSLEINYHGLCQNSCEKVSCPGGKFCLQDQNLMPHCVMCATTCQPGVLPSRLVCGSDGRTYQSACHLRQAACRMGKAIPIAYKGRCKKSATCSTVGCKGGQKCLAETETGRPRCVTCNLPCPEPEALQRGRGDAGGPVCGSNDRTYRSWCHMFADACATGLVIETKASGPCSGRDGGTTETFNGNWNYVNTSNVLAADGGV